MLGLEGTLPELSHLGSRYPLLASEDTVLFGFDPDNAIQWERRHIEQLRIRANSVRGLGRDRMRFRGQGKARTEGMGRALGSP